MQPKPSLLINRIAIVIMAFLFMFPNPGFAQVTEVEGVATIVDGDTLRIAGYRIRLAGIDAPELKQKCDYLQAEWSCGMASRNSLIAKVSDDVVRCELKKKDRYQRYIATCYLGDENLNEWLVLNGFAVAYSGYSKKYLVPENQARLAKKGIWSSVFQLPQEYRKAQKGIAVE